MRFLARPTVIPKRLAEVVAKDAVNNEDTDDGSNDENEEKTVSAHKTQPNGKAKDLPPYKSGLEAGRLGRKRPATPTQRPKQSKGARVEAKSYHYWTLNDWIAHDFRIP